MTGRWKVHIEVKTFQCFTDEALMTLIKKYANDAIRIAAERVQ